MFSEDLDVVVPGYYLVCYNQKRIIQIVNIVVVPGYYLVCYNERTDFPPLVMVVVPGYYLVCYNCDRTF